MTENERTDSHFEWVQDRVSARLDRKNAIEKKVGVVGSSGRAGQAAQGIASVAIPGDLSEWRSPVRSRVYGADRKSVV